MYCSHCGQSQDPLFNYCQYDGTALQPKKEGLTFKQRESQYCSACGEKNNTSANYCAHCAQSLLTPTKTAALLETANSRMKQHVQSDSVRNLQKSMLQPHRLLTAAITTVASFIVVILLALVLHTTIDSSKELSPTDALFSPQVAIGNVKSSTSTEQESYKGITDWVMGLHSVSSTLDASKTRIRDSGSEDVQYAYNTSFSGGFFVLLLLPILLFTVAGYVYARFRSSDSLLERFTMSLAIGFLYSVIIGITSFIAGFSFDKEIKLDSSSTLQEITLDYSFWSAFYHAFLLATLFSFLGMLLQYGSFRTTKHLVSRMKYGMAFHQAFATLWRGTLISMLFVFIMITIQWIDSSSSKDSYFTLLLTVGSQVGIFLWSILNGSNLHFDFIEKGGETTTFSIFGGFSEDKPPLFMSGVKKMLEQEVHIYWLAYGGILLSLALFIYAGYKMYQHNRQVLLQQIGVFACTYAVLASLFISWMSFSAEMSSKETSSVAFFGFSFWSTLFITLIVSALLTYAGSFIAKLRLKS
ncbi:hypothetical protein A374_15848 [Fictibacillus macauensis ZFHKF-1]|uniref:Uncharacterized protein n=1 Tax=Fictibacillus macauensis ZFHKF-1 TaxID=1196324 RepID=I8AFV7_9BACL|nr:zinc ribbon domain-containing protein [Fictibacillus macauensis]EIT84274.1 hypothetical protein A374_15848 [Fictibacillus macauensis ZFHKF-1]